MSNQNVRPAIINDRQSALIEMFDLLENKLMDKWYPLAIDNEYGGYFTNISYDWKLEAEQPKMIVTQARHIWATSKAAMLLNNTNYSNAAIHGFDFLKRKMWDKQHGGFYQMRSRDGGFSDYLGFKEEKRTYGNAFGVYGLAALYELTKDEHILNFAKEVFDWIEQHTFDPKYMGYFQFINPEGFPFDKESKYKTTADDSIELGYKDQNSSIHLMEAYTELFNVWPDARLRKKLFGLLTLIRDTITTQKGYMNLFFEEDWTPVSFGDAPKEVREQNYRLDHVSFGHDYETAFLMLEASFTLGLENDFDTISVAKKMLDHAIVNGWDSENGGFFDAGYYMQGNNKCTIIQETKNWWAQAEGLNALLLMSKIFPDNKIYLEYFEKQWKYIKNYLIDNEHGGWFEGGLDKEPHFKHGPKGHIWKCTYHTARALMNCIKMLADDDFYLMKENEGFYESKTSFDKFLNHWAKKARKLEIY